MEYYLNLKHLSDTISVCDTQESASLRIQEIRLPTLLEGTDSHEFGNMSHSKTQLEALGSWVTYLHVTRRVKTRINQPDRSRSSTGDHHEQSTSTMAMALRVPSPPLDYPDLDSDSQDELVLPQLLRSPDM